jgi:hypothetical protein
VTEAAGGEDRYGPDLPLGVGEVEITRMLEFEAALFEPPVIYPEISREIIERHRAWLEPTLMDPISGLMIFSLRQGNLSLVDTTIRKTGFVPGFGLRRILHGKADCATIGVAGRLAIDGLADHETAAIVRVGQAASRVLCTRLSAHCGKEGIVEFLRPGNIVAADLSTTLVDHSRLDRTAGEPAA